MKNNNLHVIAIGASAGGLDAIQQLIKLVPDNTGFAFVIIQHLSPDFKSLMPELLSKFTTMPIYTAKDKQVIKPNAIYLNTNNKNLHVKDNKLYLLEKGPKHNLNLPIDIFFNTLGEEYKEKAVGIIMSGTGSDGSRGIKSIKEGGGTIIVQNPTTAQFDGMINSAIGTNLVDFVLNIEDIAKFIVKIPDRKLNLSTPSTSEDKDETIFKNILQEVNTATKIDFKHYKKNTLLRRLEKRLNINNLDNLDDYYIFLRNNPRELETLKQDFLIGVTSFFRDKEAFKALEEKIIPNLFTNKKPDDQIRIWVPACSRGKEAYSIAILIYDYIIKNNLNQDFKIFATDVDKNALEIASQGSFHTNVMAEIGANYLDNYFNVTENKLLIKREIRNKIVFSYHDLLKDPPFIKMDLISCRNLLIYLEKSVQQKVISNFQFALNNNSYLFLGSSESLGENTKYFKVIDQKWKIYQSNSKKKLITSFYSNDKISTDIYKSQPKQLIYGTARFKENPEVLFHKYLSKKFGPSSIFIDKNYNILFIKGNAGERLLHNEGIFENNLLKMVSPEVGNSIRAGIKSLDKDTSDVLIKNIEIVKNNTHYALDISIHKPELADDLENVYLLKFSEDKEIDTSTKILEQGPIDKASKQRLEELEEKLKTAKAELQNFIEELETSNEELQSSNEELMASNEELQSTNEELQSVNEEIYTVNAEIQEKNKELLISNNDMNHLLNSTEIGTLFLDLDFCIRKFTPSIQKIFNLVTEDIGRPIANFASNLSEEFRSFIVENAIHVLEKLTTIEKEIIDDENNTFLARIIPFITIDKKIDGVVITFTDITKVKETERQLSLSESKYKELFNNQISSITVYKKLYNKKNDVIDLEIIDVNDKTEELFKLPKNKILNQKISKLIPGFKRNYKNVFTAISNTNDNEKSESIEVFFKEFDAWCKIKSFSYQKDIVVSITDNISERKEIQKLFLKEKAFREKITETSPSGIYIYNVRDHIVEYSNNACKDIHGYTKDDLNDLTRDEFMQLFHDDHRKAVVEHMQLIMTEKKERSIEYQFKTKRSKWKWMLSTDTPFEYDTEGNVVSYIGTFVDITISKQQQEKEKHLYKELVKANEIGKIGGWTLDIKTGAATWNEELYKIYKRDPKLPVPTFQEQEKYYNKREWSKINKAIENAIITGEPYSIEVQMKPNKNERVWIKGTGEPIKDNRGNVIGLRGIAQDITEQKENELALKKAKKRAEVANIYKNQFLANMSHEIRTPINGILGFADLLGNEDLEDTRRSEYIDIIKSSSNQLLNLINDIIDVSKLEAGELHINNRPFDLDRTYSNIASTFKQIKKQKDKDHLKLKLTLPDDDKNHRIISDEYRVSQVITNLLNNAIKFSEKGTIEFGYRITENMIIGFVKDQGMGIPKKKLDDIFKRFEQLEQTDPNTNEGTGLGLAITQGILKLLKGEISVVSILGKGTTFEFSFPYHPVSENSMDFIDSDYDQPHVTSCDVDAFTILVAEDSLVNIKLFEQLFIKQRKVYYAQNGINAVELYKAHPEIDIVLMDINMPYMDGEEATKLILEHNPEAKIIAQTAKAMTGDKEKYLKLGFSDYISKPINKNELRKKIDKVCCNPIKNN